MRSYIGIPMAVGKGNGKGNGDGDGNGEILLHCFQPPLPPPTTPWNSRKSSPGSAALFVPFLIRNLQQNKKKQNRGGGGEEREKKIGKKNPHVLFRFNPKPIKVCRLNVKDSSSERSRNVSPSHPERSQTPRRGLRNLFQNKRNLLC